MSRPYFTESTSMIQDAIDQADWLAAESGYTDTNDLWASDPQLFVTLAIEWREEHPMSQLGG